MRAIPVALKDAVELWARERGKHARVFWHRVMRCAVIEFELKPNDPRLGPWQRGETSIKPKDLVFLADQSVPGRGYVPLDLEQLGVSGVIDLLNEGDLMSGTGRFNSIMEAVQHSIRSTRDREEKMRAEVVENARLFGRDNQRYALGDPLVPVTADLENNGQSITSS